jgi:cobalt-zinc-cadmium efflux system protein
MHTDHEKPADYHHAFKIGMVLNVGVLINGVTAFLFMSGRKSDLNIRGAFLHMAADTGISAGVVLAGIGIMVTGWQWLDAAVSFISTWGLLRDSFNLTLDAVPPTY